MGEVKHTEWEPVANEVLAALQPHADALGRKFADQLYGDFLDTVQDYLADNAKFNIGQRLASAEQSRRREWERANTAEARVAELLEAARKADAVLRAMYPTVATDRDLQKQAMTAIEGLRAAIARATGSDQ